MKHLSDETQCFIVCTAYILSLAFTECVIISTLALITILYISNLNLKQKKRIKSYQKFCANFSQKILDNKIKICYNDNVNRD